jgi:hypothetical protein
MQSKPRRLLSLGADILTFPSFGLAIYSAVNPAPAQGLWSAMLAAVANNPSLANRGAWLVVVILAVVFGSVAFRRTQSAVARVRLGFESSLGAVAWSAIWFVVAGLAWLICADVVLVSVGDATLSAAWCAPVVVGASIIASIPIANSAYEAIRRER